MNKIVYKKLKPCVVCAIGNERRTAYYIDADFPAFTWCVRHVPRFLNGAVNNATQIEYAKGAFPKPLPCTFYSYFIDRPLMTNWKIANNS